LTRSAPTGEVPDVSSHSSLAWMPLEVAVARVQLESRRL